MTESHETKPFISAPIMPRITLFRDILQARSSGWKTQTWRQAHRHMHHALKKQHTNN